MNEEKITDAAPNVVEPIIPTPTNSVPDVLTVKSGNLVPIGGSIQSAGFGPNQTGGANPTDNAGWQLNSNGVFRASPLCINVTNTILSAGQIGHYGQLLYDNNFLYIYTYAGWKKVALVGI